MNIRYSVIVIMLFVSFNLYSQQNNKLNDDELLKVYNDFEKYYSIDDEVVNGCPYIYSSKKIAGTPFLYNDRWNNAIIYINNKTYTNFKLKYDLVKDLVVIKIKYKGNNEQIISLNKHKIDSFNINSVLFVNSKILLPNKSTITFYEKIYEGNVSMYRSYGRRFINLYDEMTPNGKFSQIKTNLFLFKHKTFYKVNSSRSFIKYFDKKYRKEIKLYLYKNNLKIKTASQDKLRGLMFYCNTLTS